MNTPDAIWWQTPVAALAALALFIPLIFVAGIAVWFMDLIHEGYIGKTGEGIGFIMRGVQYVAAAGFAVFLPHLLLKRSNPVVVATILATLATVLVLFSVAALKNVPDDLHGWLELGASAIGIIVGAIYGATTAGEYVSSSNQPSERAS